MIRWTTAGAVATPTTVQIRVQRSYPGRVRAGAPVPTRSMSERELRDNVRFFTEGLRTPRTHPCDTLVLSGVGVARRPDTPSAIDLARSLGVTRVVLHAELSDLSPEDVTTFANRVDTLVLPLPAAPTPTWAATLPALAAAARAGGITVTTHTVLRHDSLEHLVATAQLAITAAPASHTFTFPFPIADGPDPAPPPPSDALAALLPALPHLDAAGVPTRIKGLPACMLGAESARLGRTGNRWYADADHQRDQALLFFPDVAAFHKSDACRFCAADGRCDGFFEAHLARPGFGILQPVDPSQA